MHFVECYYYNAVGNVMHPVQQWITTGFGNKVTVFILPEGKVTRMSCDTNCSNVKCDYQASGPIITSRIKNLTGIHN